MAIGNAALTLCRMGHGISSSSRPTGDRTLKTRIRYYIVKVPTTMAYILRHIKCRGVLIVKQVNARNFLLGTQRLSAVKKQNCVGMLDTGSRNELRLQHKTEVTITSQPA